MASNQLTNQPSKQASNQAYIGVGVIRHDAIHQTREKPRMDRQVSSAQVNYSGSINRPIESKKTFAADDDNPVPMLVTVFLSVS